MIIKKKLSSQKYRGVNYNKNMLKAYMDLTHGTDKLITKHNNANKRQLQITRYV